MTECGSTRKDNADLGILERFALRASFSPQGIAFRLEQHIVGSDEQGDFFWFVRRLGGRAGRKNG